MINTIEEKRALKAASWYYFNSLFIYLASILCDNEFKQRVGTYKVYLTYFNLRADNGRSYRNYIS